jgi:integrase
MATKKLTQLTVDALSPPAAGRREVFDSQLPGFGLRISKTGARSYILMTRLKGGKQVRLTLGSTETYPKVEKARERARDILQAVARGEDPTAKPEPAKPVDTVKAVADNFIIRYAKPKNRSWKGTEALLANHVLPEWGARDVRTIKRAEVRDLLDKLADGGMGAGVNRVLASIRKMFGWAVERDYLEASPAEGVKAPANEVERDRALTDVELVRVWRAAEAVGGFSGAFIKTLILTGQRRSEVAGMRWEDVDTDKAVWTLSREATKGDRSHEVPLSKQALAALPTDRTGEFVFPGRRSYRKGVAIEVPVSGFSKIKAALDAKVAERGDEAKPMASWRLHDLRRTTGTGMARLGVPVGTISRVLNHAEGGVTKIYVRFGFLGEKRAALTKWGEHVERLLDPKERDNVAQFATANG